LTLIPLNDIDIRFKSMPDRQVWAEVLILALAIVSGLYIRKEKK
jgi:hypothetical protein